MKNLLVVAVLIALLCVLRVHFLDEPLERDEGGYAYMASQMVDGLVMYRDFWESRPPGIVFIYALAFKMYGVNEDAIRFFTLIWGALTLMLIYMLALKLFDKDVAALSGLMFALFSSGPLIQGCSANTEAFILLFSVLSIYLFVLWKQRGNNFLLILSGMSFGFGFNIKQVAFDAMLAIVIYLAVMKFSVPEKNARSKSFLKSLFYLGLGFFIAWIPAIIYVLKNDILKESIYASFYYNFLRIAPAIKKGFFDRLHNTLLFMLRENLFVWIMGFAGACMIMYDDFKRGLLLNLWLIASIAALSVGGWFYPHYFIQAIAPLSILAGFAIAAIIGEIKKCHVRVRNFCAVVMALLFAFNLLNIYRCFNSYTVDEVSSIKYGPAFVFTKEIARAIKLETNRDDYIYVWGIDPEIYFYSQRRCPTRFVHNYFVRVDPRLADERRREIIRDLSLKKPKFILLFDYITLFPQLGAFLEKDYYLYSEKQYCLIYKYKANDKQ